MEHMDSARSTKKQTAADTFCSCLICGTGSSVSELTETETVFSACA